MYYAFRSVTIGGTFHAMHEGHERYIEIAAATAELVFLHLTSDKFARRIKQYQVKPYDVRAQQIMSFLETRAIANRFELKTIDLDSDVINFCLANDVTAAVVEPAYFQMFIDVNQRRLAQQMDEMCLIWKPRTKIHSNLDLSSTALEANRKQPI